MKEQQVCQKSDRCFRGKNCPRDYIPDTEWYRCFDRRKPRERLEDCTRFELIKIIHYAYELDSGVKAAIDKGFEKVKHGIGDEL